MGRNKRKFLAKINKERDPRERYREVYNGAEGLGRKKLVEINGCGRSNEELINSEDISHLSSARFEVYFGKDIPNQGAIHIHSTVGDNKILSLGYNVVGDSLSYIGFRNDPRSLSSGVVESILRSKRQPEGGGIFGELGEIKTLIKEYRARKL